MFKIAFTLIILAAGSLQARFYEHKERSLGPTGLFGVTSPTSITITRTADHIVATRNFGRNGMSIGLLGLLATGEEKYIKVVKENSNSPPSRRFSNLSQ